MEKRMMIRARADDNLETIRKRFQTHNEHTQPIIDFFL